MKRILRNPETISLAAQNHPLASYRGRTSALATRRTPWIGCSWGHSSILTEMQRGPKKTRRLRAVGSDSQYDHIAEGRTHG